MDETSKPPVNIEIAIGIAIDSDINGWRGFLCLFCFSLLSSGIGYSIFTQPLIFAFLVFLRGKSAFFLHDNMLSKRVWGADILSDLQCSTSR
ncbi:MAG: hypothetical protein DRP83_02760 [Planctomycetota bacterium]|nr:MAG: hypothetical protein DRP83_02760 [Planctomycetota bacterium]